MPRNQGYNSDGEVMSSMYVGHDVDEFAYKDDLPSMTRSEFQDDCDINLLMARYEKTGVISHVNKREPMYLDLSEVPDLQRSMQILADAEAAFMSLPAKVRAEFDNDAMRFVEFASDPENVDQMREWGLAEPAEQPPEPALVRVVTDPPANDLVPPGSGNGAGGAAKSRSE